MNLNWTNKERTLLEDQISHEKICVQKYTDYANQASDQQLKDLFQNLAQNEQEHLNTLNQLMSGQMPQLNQEGNAMANQAQQQQGSTITDLLYQQQGAQASQSTQQQQANDYFQLQNTMTPNQSLDQNLCNDMLMTEKYVSGTYDTAIFEFREPQVRNIFNHIQKEEQQHGEAIFDYMQTHGMYNPQ